MKPALAAKRWFPAIAVVAAGFVLASSGCGGTASPAGDQGQTKAAMRLLGIQYAQYLGSHNGSPPKDEAAWRSYLEAHMNELSPYGVKSVDDLLKSQRDGQPLVVVYGKAVPVPEQVDLTWTAYEQTGVGGKRLVCNTRGGVAELSAEDFGKLVPIK
jgi:hypothetical protein